MSHRAKMFDYLKKSLINRPLWLLLYVLQTSIFRLADFMWPKDDKLLIFSGQFGQKFSDNSKYLFQFCETL